MHEGPALLDLDSSRQSVHFSARFFLVVLPRRRRPRLCPRLLVAACAKFDLKRRPYPLDGTALYHYTICVKIYTI